MSQIGSRPGFAFTGWRSAALVVFVLLAANLTLLLGRHTGRFDASDFFCPYFILIADHARHGALLLWTPLVEGGCPAGFDPEVGALSPLTVGLAAILGPSECAFRIYWLTIWGLGGLGMLFFARHLLAPPWMAFVAAVGYMFSAAFTGQAEYTAYLTVMAALPWTLWRLDAALCQRRLLPAAQAGAVWGLAALSGYPGLIIIGECYLGGWAIGRWFCASGATTEAPGRGAMGSLRVLAVFGVVSLVALAPAYFGFLHELRGYTDRSKTLSREEAIAVQALDPKALSTFASPYAATAGATLEKQLWTTDVAMCSVYLSPILFVLGLASLWMRPREGFRWWLAGLGLFCLAAALGDHLPLRGWLFDLLPPMRYFRHPAMFRCYYLLTMTVLAVLAGRDLEETAATRASVTWKRLAIASLAASVVALATLATVCAAADIHLSRLGTAVLAGVHALLLWPGTALCAFLAWRRMQAPSDTTICPVSALFGRRLVALCIADAVLTVILARPAMYTKRSEMWPEVEAAHRGSIDLTAQGLDRSPTWAAGLIPPLDACLVSKVPVLHCFNVLHNKLYEEETQECALAAGLLGSDRIWFASQASLEPLTSAAVRRLAARAEAAGGPPVILADPAKTTGDTTKILSPTADSPLFAASLEQLAPAARIPIRLRHYDDRRLEFDVRAPSDGWLLTTDRWALGWQAWVNDRPTPVWIGNLAFRALPVRQGDNRVRFLYQPFGHPWLTCGSWLALALVGVASTWAAVRRKRPSL